jgi:hypothetical protein
MLEQEIPPRKPLEHHEKVVLSIIGGLGVGVLVLGYLQLAFNLKNTINTASVKAPADLVSQYSDPNNPLTNLDITNAAAAAGPGATPDPATIAALKKKDTDGDRLSDYDELYVYHTSPYLRDTDGDGISDYDEVKNGTDPNCPQGTVCQNTDTSVTPLGTNTNLNVPLHQALPPTTPALTNTDMQAQLQQAIPLAKLREILVQQGMTQDQVNQIDDATLKQIYNDTLTNISQQQTNQPTQ